MTSSIRIRLGATLIAACTWCGVPAHALGIDRVISTQSLPTKLAAYGGRVVWSAYDAADKRFYLTELVGQGAPRRLAIRPRRIPFDVDLGPGPGGRPFAVYSRCRTERPDSVNDPTFLPLWEEQRGCRLYELNLESEQEHAVPGERRMAGVSDFLPSIWNGRLAFVRESIADKTPRGSEPPERLEMLDLRSGRLERLAAGPRGRGGAGGDNLYPTGPGALDLDLRGQTLSYRWSYVARRCPGLRRDDQLDPILTQLRIARPGATSRVYGSSCAQDDPSTLIAGNQSSGTFTFATTQVYGSNQHSTFYRRAVSGKRVASGLQLGNAFLVSLASSRGLYAVTYDRSQPPGNTVQIVGLS